MRASHARSHTEYAPFACSLQNATSPHRTLQNRVARCQEFFLPPTFSHMLVVFLCPDFSGVRMSTDRYGTVRSYAPRQIKPPYLTVPIRTSGAPLRTASQSGHQERCCLQAISGMSANAPLSVASGVNALPDTDEYGSVRMSTESIGAAQIANNPQRLANQQRS